jgi:uncharacterized protein with HEPN domain
MFEKDKLNLLSTLEALSKILEYSKGYNNADEFFQNQRDFDAAMMNFIIIGEMVSRLSDGFMEKFNHVEWYKIRAFRNLIAHNYFGIDAEEVWDIIRNHLPKLHTDFNQILKQI